MSFKEQLLISVAPVGNIFFGKLTPLPVPYWLLLNLFPNKTRVVVNNGLYKLEAESFVEWSYLGRSRYIRITEKGREKLLKRVKFFNFMRELWDYRFRVVLFDIPEVERKLRTELRLILADLGFAVWQKSAFITPHIIEEEFERIIKRLGLGLLEKANLLLVYKIASIDERDLVWKLWRLPGLNERYRDFISQAEGLLGKKIGERKYWVLECQKLRFAYYTLLCNEPFLPKELLGERYLFNTATSYFERLGEKLVMVSERV